MNRTTRTLLALPFAAAFVLGACSDDDSDTSTDTLTTEEFQAQGNAFCTDASDDAEAALGPVFEAGDDVTPEQLQDGYERMIELANGISDGIGGLAAPEELQDELDAWVAAFEGATEEIEAGGAEAFFANEGDPWLASNDEAEALGLTACAES